VAGEGFFARLDSLLADGRRLATAAQTLTSAQLAADIDTLASGFRPAVQAPDINALLLGAETQMPSLLWTRETGRLLVALGAAPSLMLAYLADPEHKGSRLWPLRTPNQSARSDALERLSPPQRQVLAAGDASLADVLQLFSQA
jgi:hypothetical protein